SRELQPVLAGTDIGTVGVQGVDRTADRRNRLVGVLGGGDRRAVDAQRLGRDRADLERDLVVRLDAGAELEGEAARIGVLGSEDGRVELTQNEVAANAIPSGGRGEVDGDPVASAAILQGYPLSASIAQVDRRRFLAIHLHQSEVVFRTRVDEVERGILCRSANDDVDGIDSRDCLTTGVVTGIELGPYD